jgi:hypothetical protein
MRSQNAAKTAGGAIATRRDRRHFALVIAGLFGTAALAACAGGRVAPMAATELPSAATDIAARTVPPAAAPAAMPANLVGLGPADIVALLGQPDFRRTDPPAELWQYRNADCVLDIFLYGGSGGYRVVHSETRERRQTVAVGDRCGTGAAGFVGRARQSQL